MSDYLDPRFKQKYCHGFRAINTFSAHSDLKVFLATNSEFYCFSLLQISSDAMLQLPRESKRRISPLAFCAWEWVSHSNLVLLRSLAFTIQFTKTWAMRNIKDLLTTIRSLRAVWVLLVNSYQIRITDGTAAHSSIRLIHFTNYWLQHHQRKRSSGLASDIRGHTRFDI